MAPSDSNTDDNLNRRAWFMSSLSSSSFRLHLLATLSLTLTVMTDGDDKAFLILNGALLR